MKEKYTFLKDTNYEAKDTAYLDVDRIINEGMAGGNVYQAGGKLNIEESHDFHDEEPPQISD